ncbi:PAS domain-containing protein [Rhodobacteraceae bacterium RKSG542]|uniref:PAS domain-containing protein n=1 Tax=Pseudovibrio flavus TaxID=2529854 RepID=UPI0012BC96F2|nr:PAS domain-containing protein [Pseudovibrio flavus]MTI19360.1 PAS domain-containing protein [Pseudovibrio flavus]
MKHGATRTLFEYWDEIRATRSAPERGDIQPSAIKTVLGDTFILEVRQPANFRYRLAGTRLCSIHCRELKGRDFLSPWSHQDREAMLSMLATVTQDAAASVVGITCRNDQGHTLDMEMLLLPVKVRGEGCTRILGCAVPMQRPYWLGVHPIVSQSITGLRLIWPDEDIMYKDEPLEVYHIGRPQSQSARRPLRSQPQLGSSLLKPKLPPLPQGASVVARAPHLRIIQGGRS